MFRQNEFIRSILADTLNKDEAMQTFELLDTNKDGNLTVKEISLLFGDDTKGNQGKTEFRGRAVSGAG